MMSFFDINTIFFTVWDYPVSYLELVATSASMLSVFLATRSNIFTWPVGIAAVILVAILFYQVQLFADVFLQLYFLIISVYGWYHWNKKSAEKSITSLSVKNRLLLLAVIIFSTVIVGLIIQNVHHILPSLFKLPAAYPFPDSFVLVASVIAQALLAKKIIDNWYVWIAVNIVCTALYFQKEILFMSVEYFVFLLMAIYGVFNWRKKQNI